MGKYNSVLFLIAFSLVLPSSVAEETTIIYCDNLPFKAGSWSDNHTLPLFNPRMGELIRVDLAVDLEVQQDYQFENMGSGVATVAADSSFELSISMPDSSNIITAASSSISEDLAGFDGEIDFSGPSGRTIEGLKSAGYGEWEYVELSDFIAIVPVDTISLPVATSVRSNDRVPGNCAFGMSTLVGSKVCITYTYENEDGGEPQ